MAWLSRGPWITWPGCRVDRGSRGSATPDHLGDDIHRPSLIGREIYSRGRLSEREVYNGVSRYLITSASSPALVFPQSSVAVLVPLPAAMASSRSLILVGLLVACLCATASAGRVAPVEKLDIGSVPVNIFINVRIDISFLHFDLPTDGPLHATANGAEGPVGTVVGELAVLVETIDLQVTVSTDPLLTITIFALGKSEIINLPLTEVDPDFNTADPGTNLVQVAITVVKTAADAWTVQHNP